MTYEVIIYEQAQMDLAMLAKSEPKAFAKAPLYLRPMDTMVKNKTTYIIYTNNIITIL